MSQLVTTKEHITPQWLTQVLDRLVVEVEITDVGSGERNHKWQLLATFEGGETARFFLKTSRRAHEARFYEAIQDNSNRMPVVPCYDVVIDGEKSHILLEDMTETHEARPPSQLPPINAACEQIVDALADFHSYWWDHPLLDSQFGGKLSTTEWNEWFSDDAELYAGFADFLADRLPQSRREMYETAIKRLPSLVIGRFEQGNLTLVFEDVHAGNFLYPRNADDQLYFIDWEQWGVNPGMNDLAYMIALFWSPERRSRLEVPYLRRYHNRLLANGVVGYDWDALWQDYRLCVIRHLFVPVYQWRHGNLVDVWWNHIERITAAFEDLNCMELLA